MNSNVDHEFQLTADTSDVLSASGVLSFATATRAWEQLRSAVAEGGHPPRQLDLAGIRHSDSAGLSCVLAIMAEVARHGRGLHVLNVPDGMRSLAQVCEVDQLLG